MSLSYDIVDNDYDVVGVVGNDHDSYLERSWNVHRGGTHHNRRTDHLCWHHSDCDLHKLDTLNEGLNK